MNYMIVLYSIVAAFIAWIWVDYYRLVDIYNKKELKYVILTFLLGCGSVYLVIAIDKYLLSDLSFKLNGNGLNDLLYCVFHVGLVEELAKTVPLIIMLLLFRKHFNNPIDYVAFISISALGFSAVENVGYFNDSPAAINMRAILCSLGHMCYSALIGYGIVLMKFKNKKFQPFLVIGFVLLAALAHGIYDFLIINNSIPFAWLFTVLYFFLLISVFATILSNSLNNSSNFSYKKVVNSDKIATRIMIYYAIVFILQFFVMGYQTDFNKALLHFQASVYVGGFIIIISVLRLSQLKLIQNRWQPLKLELPFVLNAPGQKIKIKGESYTENRMGTYYEEYFTLCPLSKTLHIEKPRLAYIEKKIFLKYDETLFLAKVFYDDVKEKFEYMILKPKIKDKTLAFDKYPIIGLLKVSDTAAIEDTTKSSTSFKFLEWAYAKPLKIVEESQAK